MPTCVRLDPDGFDAWAENARRGRPVTAAAHNSTVAIIGSLADAIASPSRIIRTDGFSFPIALCDGVRVPLVGSMPNPGDTRRSRPEHAGGIDALRGRWWRGLSWVLFALRAPAASPQGDESVRASGALESPIAGGSVVALAGASARAAAPDYGIGAPSLYENRIAGDYAAKLVPGASEYAARLVRVYRTRVEANPGPAERDAAPFLDDAERFWLEQRAQVWRPILVTGALWGVSKLLDLWAEGRHGRRAA